VKLLVALDAIGGDGTKVDPLPSGMWSNVETVRARHNAKGAVLLGHFIERDPDPYAGFLGFKGKEDRILVKRVNGVRYAGRLVDEHHEKRQDVFTDQAFSRVENARETKTLRHHRIKAIGVEDLPHGELRILRGLGAATRIVDVTNQALFRFLRHITQRDLSCTSSIALDGVFSNYTRNNHEALFTELFDLCGT
jgi:hypothetical protein